MSFAYRPQLQCLEAVRLTKSDWYKSKCYLECSLEYFLTTQGSPPSASLAALAIRLYFNFLSSNACLCLARRRWCDLNQSWCGNTQNEVVKKVKCRRIKEGKNQGIQERNEELLIAFRRFGTSMVLQSHHSTSRAFRRISWVSLPDCAESRHTTNIMACPDAVCRFVLV